MQYTKAAKEFGQSAVIGAVAYDTTQWASGRIDTKEYGTRTSGHAGGAAGAALGTLIMPGAGTLIGGYLGDYAGRSVFGWFSD